MSRGGLALLAETGRVAGLERELRQRLAPWRRARAVHDPARVLTRLTYALTAGGDCLADIALLPDARAIVGAVPSDPMVCRVIDDLAGGGQQVLDAIAAAHAAVRARVHAAGGGPRGQDLVPVDIDPTIVVAHSEKELATPTFKRTFGHHPVLAFLDHGDGATGEALAGQSREGPVVQGDTPVAARLLSVPALPDKGATPGRSRAGTSSIAPPRRPSPGAATPVTAALTPRRSGPKPQRRLQ